MKIEFLNLGRQPIANGFRTKDDKSEEQFFDLRIGFDDETNLVSLMGFVDKSKLFNDEYVYVSSGSETMRRHFSAIASMLKARFGPSAILEIGSNDGVFIDNFDPDSTVAVEPCGNFAEITNSKGHKTFSMFWNAQAADAVLAHRGPVDVVFAANCMCHIPELLDAFVAVESVLAPFGIFVFEDPSLDEMIRNYSFDQIYDEHAHIFSVIALSNVLELAGLEIFDVERIGVHGGSNRIYAKRIGDLSHDVTARVGAAIGSEVALGLDSMDTYKLFAQTVRSNCQDLVTTLSRLKNEGHRVIGYGATSKSTVVYNYCGIGPGIIDYISDTTAHKQGKLSPGVHIPVVPPTAGGIEDGVDYAFLGAWNFKKEIMSKEKAFIDRGGKFITHVPSVHVIP